MYAHVSRVHGIDLEGKEIQFEVGRRGPEVAAMGHQGGRWGIGSVVRTF